MQVAIALAILGLATLAGCRTSVPVVQPEPPRVQQPDVPSVPPPVPVAPLPAPIPTPAERALGDGIALYDAGDFNGAIKRLRGAKEIWTDSTTPAATADKVAALKYVAFSYCVTKRRTQCRQQFVEALKIDPGFNLEPAERKHPIWGAEFERAKKQASAPAAPAKRQAPRAATSSSPANTQ